VYTRVSPWLAIKWLDTHNCVWHLFCLDTSTLSSQAETNIEAIINLKKRIIDTLSIIEHLFISYQTFLNSYLLMSVIAFYTRGRYPMTFNFSWHIFLSSNFHFYNPFIASFGLSFEQQLNVWYFHWLVGHL